MAVALNWRANVPEPKRGDVWFGDLDPTRGHEQAGRRPLLVVSDDLFNASRANLVVVLPLTTKHRGVPNHVEILPPEGGITRGSWIQCEAVRSISKERLATYLGNVTVETMENVELGLKKILRL
jgi:mRNA interferase MazF